MDESLGAGTAYSPSPPVTVNHSAPLSPPPAPTSTTTHAARRPAPRVVVLQAAAQHVRGVVVGRHHVELPDREVVQEPPALGAVLRDIHTAVVPLDHAVGVLRVDP